MFLHRLAMSLGKTVGQLLHELDLYGDGPGGLVEWAAYDRIEPFGHQMDNFRMGVIASTVANVARTKKGSKAYKPSDFYPSAARKPLTPRQEQELARRRKNRGK